MGSHANGPKLTNIVGAFAKSGYGLVGPVPFAFMDGGTSATGPGIGIGGAVGEGHQAPVVHRGELPAGKGAGGCHLKIRPVPRTTHPRPRPPFPHLTPGPRGFEVGDGGRDRQATHC